MRSLVSGRDFREKGSVRISAGLDFLNACATESNTLTVIDQFLEVIQVFGFEVGSAGAWVGPGAARAHRFYFNNWPADWFELYEAKGYVVHDPVVLETRRRMTPFLWSEMTASRTFTVEGAAVAAAGRAYGWAEVMGVPIHGPAGYQGLVAMAARAAVTLAPAEQALLRVMALSVHDRAHAAVGLGLASRPHANMSARETECMSWVAAGKTDLEVGIILGISPATVHFHVEGAKKKLNCRSRSEAVALLVRDGMV
jgi:DNA-binding CsgD family transcriptional regulator